MGDVRAAEGSENTDRRNINFANRGVAKPPNLRKGMGHMGIGEGGN